MTKVCNKCGIEKNIKEYGIRKQVVENKIYVSRNNSCKKCVKIYDHYRKKRMSKKAWLSGINQFLIKYGYKICPSCDEVLELERFSKDKNRKTKTPSSCKNCISKRLGSDRRKSLIVWLNKQLLSYNLKMCNKCFEWKSFDSFNMRNINNNYLESRCRECGFTGSEQSKAVQLNRILIKNNKRKCSTCGEICYIQDMWGYECKNCNIQRKLEREKKDPIYKFRRGISKLMYMSLRREKGNRHWEDLVGYTLEKLKHHLESLFIDNMSWNNYGKWHVDHIIPQTLFKFKTPEDNEFKQCWALANLQPLWAEENRKKGARYLEVK